MDSATTISENIAQPGPRSYFKTKSGIILKVAALWHVELSETRHAYLHQSDGVAKLNIRQFKLKYPEPDCEYLYPTNEGLSLTIQQTLDLMLEMYALSDVLERDSYFQVSFSNLYIYIYIYIYL